MHFLFPADPFHPSTPDEEYAAEYVALRDAGASCSLFSLEDFEAGRFKAKPPIPLGEALLYRGWMLTPDAYGALSDEIMAKGGRMLTHPTQYRRCHYLPEWYPNCRDITPETVVVDRGANFVDAVAARQWSAYFVKDYVKSLTTARGSVATTPEAIAEIVDLIEHYRGKLEGGVCIRQFERLRTETEERYFVFHGAAYSRTGTVPPLVDDIAQRIDSPFFSVDLVESENGELRLIELGDGQVSDRKKWTVAQFASMLGWPN